MSEPVNDRIEDVEGQEPEEAVEPASQSSTFVRTTISLSKEAAEKLRLLSQLSWRPQTAIVEILIRNADIKDFTEGITDRINKKKEMGKELEELGDLLNKILDRMD